MFGRHADIATTFTIDAQATTLSRYSDLASEIAVMTDEMGCVIKLSSAAQLLLGWDEKAVLGHDISYLFVPSEDIFAHCHILTDLRDQARADTESDVVDISCQTQADTFEHFSIKVFAGTIGYLNVFTYIFSPIAVNENQRLSSGEKNALCENGHDVNETGLAFVNVLLAVPEQTLKTQTWQDFTQACGSITTTQTGLSLLQDLHLNEEDCADYDLVIVDEGLPVVGGIDVARIVKRNISAYQQTPIVMLASPNGSSQKDEAFLAGVDGVLAPNPTLEALISATQNWALAHGRAEFETEDSHSHMSLHAAVPEFGDDMAEFCARIDEARLFAFKMEIKAWTVMLEKALISRDSTVLGDIYKSIADISEHFDCEPLYQLSKLALVHVKAEHVYIFDVIGRDFITLVRTYLAATTTTTNYNKKLA